MEKRTSGAWILHHTKKLQDVTNSQAFDDIELAGKCGLFLSNLAASDEQSNLSRTKTEAIADAININKRLELPIITKTLSDAQLIDVSKSGDISVLGITTSNVLNHTSDIFTTSTSDNFQKAALELSNYISDKPIKEKELKEYISDIHHLDLVKNNQLFELAEEISLVDFEDFDSEKTYFNGNLFKRDSIEKTTKVLESLKADDSRKIKELDLKLEKEGCVDFDTAQKIIGANLLNKLQSIGKYDFNEVSNSQHSKIFLTTPSAFSKFGNPFEEDALDMAKAFISSLYYGMKLSSSNRGKIQDQIMLHNTVKKLLRGEKVGPCTAIGEDYRLLELNRVVQLEKSIGSRYYMRLLKNDIGRLALSVLERGDIAEEITVPHKIQSSSVTNYIGPEKNRMKVRLKKNTSGNNLGELLRTLRN